MKHTLVAAFANLTDANRTRGDLMARGIAREQIHAVGAESADIHRYDAPYSTNDKPLDRTHHDSKIAHFFKSLFGHESHDEHRYYAAGYHEAVRRGSLVIAVDVLDDDELVRARDALEYNGAISIDDRDGPAATGDYAGPTSPYAGATGGDSHLDKHFAETPAGAAGATGTHTSARPAAAAPVTPVPGARLSGETASTGYVDHSADTGRYDIGSAAKRAGTDYPDTAATANPTGAGTTGTGTSVPGAGTATPIETPADKAGARTDRVYVIRRDL